MPGHNSLRVMLVEDQALVRAGFTRILTAAGHEVVAALSGAQAALDRITQQPDVLITDLRMPGMDGFALTRVVRATEPGVRVLAMSGYASGMFVRGALDAGAGGFIAKTASPEALLEALEAVADGRRWIDPHVDPSWAEGPPAPDPSCLSPREREVFLLLAEGTPNAETAARLGISVRTVDSHRARILSKLDLRGNAALARFAVIYGLLD